MSVSHDAMVVQTLNMLFNKAEIYCVIEEITGCPKIGRFIGRIYMMCPDSEDYDSWHNDFVGNRLIGLSLNLTVAPNSGGHFLKREKTTEHVINEIANNISGTHIFFKYSMSYNTA